MASVILVFHILVAVSMIVIILLQRSEGGALGMGGGGGFVSSRGVANLFTRMTAILAAIFFSTSLGLGIIGHRTAPASAVGAAPIAGSSQTGQPPIAAEDVPGALPEVKVPRQRDRVPEAGAQPSPIAIPGAPAAPATPNVPEIPQPSQVQVPQSQ